MKICRSCGYSDSLAVPAILCQYCSTHLPPERYEEWKLSLVEFEKLIEEKTNEV